MQGAKKKEETYNFLLETGKELAKRKLGTLFIIARKRDFRGAYEPLYPQVVKGARLSDKGSRELILKLAELDGAFLVGHDGRIVAFGARIKKSKVLPGNGTKHAAAVGFTSHVKNSVAVLVSEETNWVKVFKKGKIILEMDSTKTPESVMHDVVAFVADNDTALLATAGVSAAIFGFIPVVIISGTYLTIKTASGLIKKSLRH